MGVWGKDLLADFPQKMSKKAEKRYALFEGLSNGK